MEEKFFNLNAKGSKFALLVLILALVAFTFSFFAAFKVIGFMLSLFLIVLSALSVLSAEEKGLSIAALLLSVLSLTIVIVMNSVFYNKGPIARVEPDNTDIGQNTTIVDSNLSGTGTGGHIETGPQLGNKAVEDALPLDYEINVDEWQNTIEVNGILDIQISTIYEGKTEEGVEVTKIGFEVRNISDQNVNNIKVAIVGKNQKNESFMSPFYDIEIIEPNHSFSNAFSQMGIFVAGELRPVASEMATE